LLKCGGDDRVASPLPGDRLPLLFKLAASGVNSRLLLAELLADLVLVGQNCLRGCRDLLAVFGERSRLGGDEFVLLPLGLQGRLVCGVEPLVACGLAIFAAAHSKQADEQDAKRKRDQSFSHLGSFARKDSGEKNLQGSAQPELASPAECQKHCGQSADGD
jgi:hypothetical protein